MRTRTFVHFNRDDAVKDIFTMEDSGWAVRTIVVLPETEMYSERIVVVMERE